MGVNAGKDKSQKMRWNAREKKTLDKLNKIDSNEKI